MATNAEVSGMLNGLAAEIHEWAVSKGFYDRDSDGNYSFDSEKLLLVVSEITEAQSAMRDGEGYAEEIADAIIRLLDFAAWHRMDIGYEILKKIETNNGRPYLHGRKVF